MNHNNEQHGMGTLKFIPSQLLKGGRVIDLGRDPKNVNLINQPIPYLYSKYF